MRENFSPYEIRPGGYFPWSHFHPFSRGRIMRRLISAAVLLVALTPGAMVAVANDCGYWELTSDTGRRYQNVDNPDDEVLAVVEGEAYDSTIWRVIWYVDGNEVSNLAHLLAVDDECNGWVNGFYDPLSFPDTPLLQLSVPLAVGNTWDSWIVWEGIGSVHHVFEVVAEETVIVPGGESEVVFYSSRAVGLR